MLNIKRPIAPPKKNAAECSTIPVMHSKIQATNPTTSKEITVR